VDEGIEDGAEYPTRQIRCAEQPAPPHPGGAGLSPTKGTRRNSEYLDAHFNKAFASHPLACASSRLCRDSFSMA